MKHLIQSALLAAFLLSPAAAFAGENTDGCKCHTCQGKDGKCDKKSCDCHSDCKCHKDGSCGADCPCHKSPKR